MERFRFTHLSGPRRGETDVLERLPATLGSDPDSDVKVPGAAPRHAVLLRRDGDVVIEDTGAADGTFLAGEAVREAVLRDGDVLELGPGGPQLRFRHEGAPRPHPLLLAVRRRLHHTSHGFRITVAILLGIAVLAVHLNRHFNREMLALRETVRTAEQERLRFQARIEEERSRAEAERRSLEQQIAEYREREEALRQRLVEGAGSHVQSLRRELTAARSRLETLESERAAGEKIIRDYGAGVCLLQGSYAFYDDANQPLRRKLDEKGHVIRDDEGAPLLDSAGKGDIYTVDYFGTGFLIRRNGLVLTNRHLAQPWWNDSRAQGLIGRGFRPRFVLFRAFFPRVSEPFELEMERHADNVDLALVRIDLHGRKIPVLPLDAAREAAVAGQPVVVVGYPTGLEAILAKAESRVVSEILEAHGTNSERVTEVLSERGLIRPSTTQGHIGDITKTDIVFDAPTTQGGSGGPVFNKNGKVIAVEYAVLSKFGGNSFGIPIHYAAELLLAPPRKKPGD